MEQICMNGFISHVYWLNVSFRTSLWKIYDVCIYVSWGVISEVQILGAGWNTACATGTRTSSKGSSARWSASFATIDVHVRIAGNCCLWACLAVTAVEDCMSPWMCTVFFLSLSQDFMEFNYFVCLLLWDITWFVELITVLVEVFISSFYSCDNDCESIERWLCCFRFFL